MRRRESVDEEERGTPEIESVTAWWSRRRDLALLAAELPPS
jgi:hypothetical protein